MRKLLLQYCLLPFTILAGIGCGPSKEQKLEAITQKIKLMNHSKEKLEGDLSILNKDIREEQMKLVELVSAENQKYRSTMGAIEKKGEALFAANCLSCHAGADSDLGPDLSHISNSRDREWLVKFIKNSQKLILSGDPLANKIYAENDEKVMTSFDHLSRQDILAILDYVNFESKNPNSLTKLNDELESKYFSEKNRIKNQIDSVVSLITLTLAEIQRIDAD